jgi:hypothetical protein
VSGIVAGEGLARLEDGSLIVGFFLLREKELEMESSSKTMKKGVQRITLTWAN